MAEAASEDNIKRVERELAKEDRLLNKMIEQAPGMLGMAFMFIITILMGVLVINPLFSSFLIWRVASYPSISGIRQSMSHIPRRVCGVQRV